jgi:uncharacterized lipoprotein YajG
MVRKTFLGPLVALSVLGLGACSNTLPLNYTGTEKVSSISAAVSSVTVSDRRGESDPTWYGAIRGGYGNPLKTLHSAKPIQNTVREAFVTALAARGVRVEPGSSGKSISVVVMDFEADSMMRSEANIRMTVTVADPATGRQLYKDEVGENPVEWTGAGGGILGSPQALQGLTERTMNRVIDEVADNPAFQAALRSQD